VPSTQRVQSDRHLRDDRQDAHPGCARGERLRGRRGRVEQMRQEGPSRLPRTRFMRVEIELPVVPRAGTGPAARDERRERREKQDPPIEVVVSPSPPTDRRNRWSPRTEPRRGCNLNTPTLPLVRLRLQAPPTTPCSNGRVRAAIAARRSEHRCAAGEYDVSGPSPQAGRQRDTNVPIRWASRRMTFPVTAT